MVGHVGLRRLLQQLATELRDYGPLDEVAVRIVAHGRGAELACGALWDFANTTRHPECDLAKLRQRQPAKEAVDRPLPFADLRVGFVAAAMGTDVLRHYAEFDQVGVDAFVLGNSTCDWVLYKRLLGWMCEPLVPVLTLGQASLGKTSVGRGHRGGWAVRRVTKALAGTDTEVYWLDFGQSSHDLCRYVRNPLFPRFLDDLLAPAHPEDRLPSRPKPGA